MVFDITKMASKDLSVPITTGLQKVFSNKEEIKYTNVKTTIGDEKKNLNIRIKPLSARQNQEPLAAIILTEDIRERQECVFESEQIEYDMDKVVEQRINDLEHELQFTRENLQATIEELETSNEELQATNEELFASNEELQATNEELQSVNEELHTVNAEYQAKIIELTELNQDVENLMSNTQIGTLFLDENLEIRKFTSMIKNIFHLVDNDIGRPLEGIANKIMEFDILDMIKLVRDTSTSHETEVQTKDDRWYLLKIVPYKVGRDIYSGMIITIVDITTLKRTQRSLEKSEIWLHEAASLAKVGGWEIDPVTMKTLWTEEVYNIHEVEPGFDHNVEKGIEFYHPEDRKKIEEAVSMAFEKAEPFDLKLRFVTAKGNEKSVRVKGKAEKNHKGIKRVYGSFQDITEQTLKENELKKTKTKYKELYETITSPTIVCEDLPDGRFVIKEINCAGKYLFWFSSTSCG
jgi:two-component system CheB/CheR fusion protein